MARMIAESEVLEVLEPPLPSEPEQQRLEIFDYAVASTLEGDES